MSRKEKAPKLTPQQKGRAIYEAGLVRDDQDGTFSVGSSDPDLKGWWYLVRPRTAATPATCDCEDYRYHRDLKPDYRCKHIWAVRAHLEAQRAAKPPSIRKNNEAMERFLREQEAKKAQAPRTLSLEDQLAEVAQQIERGDRSELTRARYTRLYQRWSEQGDPPLAFLPAF